jgi:hypothetical protein
MFVEVLAQVANLPVWPTRPCSQLTCVAVKIQQVEGTVYGAWLILGDRVTGFEEQGGDTKSVKRILSEKSVEVEYQC